MTANTVTNTPAWSKLPVTAVAIAISCVLSLISIAQNPLLNDDAYLYLRAAELFNTDGAAAVLRQYSWFGYSMLIALLDRVIPGDALVSAQLLNTASYALVVYAFIALVRECHSTVRVHWFAALTILAYPLINEMRYFLIRDFAFWGFGLLSLLHLVRYQRNGRWQHALSWCLALLAAIAFRPEGLLLAAFAPVALLASQPVDKRWARLGLLYALLAAALLLSFLLLLTMQVNIIELFQFAYRYYLPQLYDFGNVFTTGATALNQALYTPTNYPGHDNLAHGGVILVFAYLYTLLANAVNALSVPFSALLAYGVLSRQLQVPPQLRAPLLAYLLCSLLGLLIFLFIMHFLTERYATFLCVLLLLLVPALLDNLYVAAESQQRTLRFRAAAGLLFTYLFIDGLISFGHSTSYIDDAMTWARDELPRDASLHTNEYGIAYASGLVAQYDKVSPDILVALRDTQVTHYLALSLKAGDDELRTRLDALPQLVLLQRFANDRGDEVRIYQHR